MDADRIEIALADLGAEARALVELSVIREIADEDIASLLGSEEEAVRSRREDAMAVLAASLGASSGEEVGGLMRDMRELPAVRWRDDESDQPTPKPEPIPPVVQAGAKRKRRIGPAFLGGVLVAAVVALILALSGGGEDDEPAPANEPVAPSAQAGERAKLAPVAGGAGEGSARLTANTLELSVTGLPDPGRDGYVVWLYNSLSEARPLNSPQPQKAFELEAKLPQGAERYRFVDVSLEPADDNRNHSGQSVLRVPLSSLR